MQDQEEEQRRTEADYKQFMDDLRRRNEECDRREQETRELEARAPIRQLQLSWLRDSDASIRGVE